MRIGIGGIIKESHSFSPASSSLDRFKACLYLKGAQVFERLGACNHEIVGGSSRSGSMRGSGTLGTMKLNPMHGPDGHRGIANRVTGRRGDQVMTCTPR